MKKLFRLALTFFLAFAFLVSSRAMADAANVCNVTVSVHPANDRYLSLSFDLAAGGQGYTAFLTGIRQKDDPSPWAEPLAQRIADSFAGNRGLRIATRATGKPDEYTVEAIDLMDAEKQNLHTAPEWETGEKPAFASDTQLCWAAAASNALELSGWGRAVTELNPSEVDFGNEDDIFAYFAANFTDSGSLAIEGEKWFLNGVDIDQQVDRTSGEPLFGVWHWMGAQMMEEGSGGLAKKYCAASVTGSDYALSSMGAIHYATVTGLEQAADDLEKGYGVSLGIQFVGEMGGHDLCLVGAIREKLPDGGAGRVIAVFLADSDNDGADYEYSDTEAEQKAGPRGERVNSFEMYFVDETSYAEGLDAAVLRNFWMHPETDTAVTDIMSVKPFSVGLPTETEGTGDVYASPDLVSKEIIVGEDYERYTNAKTGEEVFICANISNQSFARVTDEDSAAVTIRYHIYRDGAEYDTVMKDVPLDGARLLPLSSDRDGADVTYTFTEPGVYEIGVEIVSAVDSRGVIREAYRQNNLLVFSRVTVNDGK